MKEHVEAWRIAAADPRVHSTITAIFDEANDAVSRHRPLCLASGRCCRFEEHGHRLYVTGLEAAWFMRALGETQGRQLSADEIREAEDRGDCPLLVSGLCSVHEIRPFGCRSYFCDPRATWQQEHYEKWHERIRTLHTTLDLSYFYGEWRSVLLAITEHSQPE